MKSKYLFSLAMISTVSAISFVFFNSEDPSDLPITTDSDYSQSVSSRHELNNTLSLEKLTSNTDTGITASAKSSKIDKNAYTKELSASKKNRSESNEIPLNTIESNPTIAYSNTVESPDPNPFETVVDDANTVAQIKHSIQTPSALPPEQSTFADNLLDAALDSNTAATGRAYIEFTFSPLTGVHYLPNPAVIEKTEPVYAHITASQKCGKCIVKWLHQDSGEIQILESTVLIGERIKSRYVTPEDGWKKGVYVMSVFDANDSMALIGRASLYISGFGVAPQATAANNDFVQSLLDSGLAVSKTNN